MQIGDFFSKNNSEIEIINDFKSIKTYTVNIFLIIFVSIPLFISVSKLPETIYKLFKLKNGCRNQ